MVAQNFSELEDADNETCKEENQASATELDEEKPSSSAELPCSWIRFDKEEVAFCCLWQDCQTEIDVGSPDKEICFLHDHLKDHLDEYLLQKNFFKDQKFICLVKTCNHVAPSFGYLRRHMSMHRLHAELMLKGAKLYHSSPLLQNPVVKRGECGFSSNMHVEYEGQELICQLGNCGASYEDVAEFFSHVHRDIDFLDWKDRNGDSFICRWGDCNVKCGKNKNLLRRHIASAHLFEKVVACPFCGAFFYAVSKFIEHLKRRIDESSKNWVCCVCHKRFYDEDLLTEHIVQHIGVKKCLICGAYLAQAVDMQKHVLTHSMRDRIYSCDQCTKMFYEEKHLDAHRLVHQEPSFSCLDCGKEFRTKYQLNRHKREHLQKPVYACHICSITYNYGSQLGRHFKAIHSLPIPDGFSRFTYHACEDGVYRLQTRRLIKEETGPASINLTYANIVANT